MKTLRFKTLSKAKEHYNNILKGINEREYCNEKKQPFFWNYCVADREITPKKEKQFIKHLKRSHRKQNRLFNQKLRLFDQASIWFKPFIEVGQVWKLTPLYKDEEEVLVRVEEIDHNKVRIAVINGAKFFSLKDELEPTEGSWETIEFLVSSFDNLTKN